jgi:hypothetical protein
LPNSRRRWLPNGTSGITESLLDVVRVAESTFRAWTVTRSARRGIWHLLLYQARTNDIGVLAISHDHALLTTVANRTITL